MPLVEMMVMKMGQKLTKNNNKLDDDDRNKDDGGFSEQRRHTNIRVARSQKGKSKQWPELGIGKVLFVKD